MNNIEKTINSELYTNPDHFFFTFSRNVAQKYNTDFSEKSSMSSLFFVIVINQSKTFVFILDSMGTIQLKAN